MKMHRNQNLDLRALDDAQEVDMGWAIANRMESNVLWNGHLLFATKVDLDHAVRKVAGHQQFDERLFLNMDEFGVLLVAVNYGGNTVLTTQFAGGSLASPVARLGRQCQLIAHVKSPIKLLCRHASRDVHERQARAYMRSFDENASLVAVLCERLVKAEQAGGDQNEADGKQKLAGLNALGDQCAERGCQKPANEQTAGHNGKGL